MSDPIYVAITMDSGEPLRVMSFVTGPMRGPELPPGAVWVADKPGFWTLEVTAETLAYEIRRACPEKNLNGDPLPKVVSWRTIALADIPTDREYRDAWTDTGAVIDHDLDKAKEIHRAKFNEEIATKIFKNDLAGGTSARKRELLDAMNDPRIAAARSIAELKQIATP